MAQLNYSSLESSSNLSKYFLLFPPSFIGKASVKILPIFVGIMRSVEAAVSCLHCLRDPRRSDKVGIFQGSEGHNNNNNSSSKNKRRLLDTTTRLNQ